LASFIWKKELNFGHIVRKARRRRAALSNTELHMGEKLI
jgi:hypothetical protein